MENTNKRYRNFVFTLNNPQDKPDEVASLHSLDCKYLKYGNEVGEEGTPHFQGMVIFNSAKTVSAARKALRGCHVEIMISLSGSMAYVEKDGDIFEKGTPPQLQSDQGHHGATGGAIEQERWKRLREAAEANDLDAIDEKSRYKDIKLIEHHRDRYLRTRHLEDTEEQHEWYYGASGTGKSRKAREENPDAYLKACNKWWDGYTDQDVVIIEDFDKAHYVLCHHLKIWGDRYPFPCERKGGSMTIRPQKIIVTSNYHPREIWEHASDLEPILRRFNVIEFKKLATTSS